MPCEGPVHCRRSRPKLPRAQLVRRIARATPGWQIGPVAPICHQESAIQTTAGHLEDAAKDDQAGLPSDSAALISRVPAPPPARPPTQMNSREPRFQCNL
eukprot:6931221-Pyramimonas_sp.AAC.1